MVGYGQGGNAVRVRLFAQEAVEGVGDQKHVVAPCIAEVASQPFAGQKVLGHGLYGAARLAHRHDDGLSRVEGVEPCFERVGVDVVGYPQAGAFVPGPVLLRVERLLECARAEGRTANAQQHHMAEAAQMRRHLVEVRDEGFGVGHVHEGQPPCGELRGEAVGYVCVAQFEGGLGLPFKAP